MSVTHEPSGDFMQTYTGLHFYPLDPRPEQIALEDIARALSRINRFAGHSEWAYSVAQHSVYVSGMVPLEDALCGLMHDATEAYLVDVPRPLKNAMPQYRSIERNVWRVIAQKFGLPEEMPESVKYADNCVLLAEKDQIMKPSAPWPIPGKAAPIEIERMCDDEAYWFFMERFEHLTQCAR